MINLKVYPERMKGSVKNTRVMRGAEWETCHYHCRSEQWFGQRADYEEIYDKSKLWG